MTPDHNPSSDTDEGSRHTARKNAARELAARTGMKYTAALRHLCRGTQREPFHRWILTDELRAWFAGEGWRNAYYGDLYDWLDGLTPTYDCDWCDEPGDAREIDSSIKIVIAAYDPDLSPVTAHLFTYKHHAACQPSTLTFAQQIDIPPGPQRIGLPASADTDLVGEFALETRPVLTVAFADETPQAILLITAKVVDDHGEGAAPWLTELRLNLSAQGFAHPDFETADSDGWAVRIATGYPSSLTPEWIAVRTPQSTPANPHHLLLSAMNLPAEWVTAARSAGHVTVILGPCTVHWSEPEVSIELISDDVEEQRLDSAACYCARLTPDDVVDLIESHAFVTSSLRVADHDN